jgi:hypothetical protein
MFLGRDKAEVPIKDWSFQSTTTYDVVCLPIIDWTFLFQRPQQLLTQFARNGHRTFYVRTEFHDSGPTPYLRELTTNVNSIRLPGPKRTSIYQGEIDQRSLSMMMDALEELQTRAILKEVACLTQLPFWTPLALAARQRLGWRIIYDCMDEHSGFNTNASSMLQQEEVLMKAGDLVVTTSQILYNRASQQSGNVLMLPNAADFNHFSHPGKLRPLVGIEHPVIGYYGSISYWFDVEMIRNAARSRPRWQFVLIGDTFGSDLSTLKKLSNVHILGIQPYETLPSFLHEFDVACIPFLLNALTGAADPVKFYEYLSAGKPVVAVELPELMPHQEYFFPVRSTTDFVTQVEKALSEESIEAAQKRMEFAKKHTWEHRYEVLNDAISRLESMGR